MLTSPGEWRQGVVLQPNKDPSSPLNLAFAAHELKNPAESLTNLIYLLQQNTSLNEDARKYLEMAAQELQHMRHLITHTLAQYRKRAGPTVVALPQVLDSVLRYSEHKIGLMQIQVQKRYECEGLVQANSEGLHQIFSNLVVNALEAMQPHGKLTLHVSPAHTWGDAQRAGVRVAIGDNGCGVLPQDRDNIFRQSFTTKGEKGTGLGLWMTANTIQDDGGTIRFRSSTRQGRRGTVFSVFLPSPVAGDYWPLPAAAENAEAVAAGNAGRDAAFGRTPIPVLSPKENRAASRRLVAENKRLLADIVTQRRRYDDLKVR